ncbi:MAG: hypothetical protein IPN59_16120 [Holophaga sp.]|nr:hypothetical protein [Holophaga sp.]
MLEHSLRLLPWRVVRALGSAMGGLMHRVDGRHRRIVVDNLRQSNLGLDEAQVQRTALACFHHYGALFLGAVLLLNMSREEVQRWIRVDGFEHWDAAQAAGKGFIILTAHYGHWEAMAMGLAVSGRPVAAIGRRLNNPLLEAKLLNLRTRLGNRVIYKEGGVRDSIKELRAGNGTGFLMDQDASIRGVFVRFMGRWASTHASAALLAVKYQVPVLPVYSWPNGDGTISARILAPLELPRTGDMAQDVWTATQLMTWSLEAKIHEDPRWWFWLHRRFKTLPSESLPLPPQAWQDAIQHLAPKP